MAPRMINPLYLSGLAFLLVFCLLLAARLDLYRPLFSDTSPRRVADDPESLPAQDTWMAIYQQGRKIGYAHSVLEPRKHFYRLKEQMVLHINLMGTAQSLTVETTAELNGDYTIRSFDFTLFSGAFDFSATGCVDTDNRLEVTTTIAGETNTRTIALDRAPYLSAAVVYAAARQQQLTAGDRFEFPVFDPATMGHTPVTVSVKGTETVTVGGTETPATRLDIKFKGSTQTAWIDEQGTVLKEKGLMGLTLEKTDRKHATADISPELGPDLFDRAAIETNKTIESPAAHDRMVAEIRGVSLDGFDMETRRQHRSGNTVTITKTRIDDLPESPEPPESSRFADSLAATAFVQADHGQIRDLADRIVSENTPPVRQAKAIVDWVYQNIDKRPVVSVPDALSTLQQRAGDCNEHAVLLAALARAAGIPATIEAGIAYLNGRFYYHAWNRLYVGRWVAADAALGQLPADVTHVRFISGGTERQMELMRLIEKVAIEIKAIE
ncbi:MAG: transglutaminase domain-containing protein [Thermodesulfobacteriota bacterium]